MIFLRFSFVSIIVLYICVLPLTDLQKYGDCKPGDSSCSPAIASESVNEISGGSDSILESATDSDSTVITSQLNPGITSGNGGAPEDAKYVPHSPLIPCQNLPIDFLMCNGMQDLKGDQSIKAELGYGCTKFGGQRYEDVERTSLNCTVLTGIACFGNRTFMKDGFPCIKYTGHYFLTTLIYSILLGFLGLDRFSLGHTGTAIGKVLTLGGLGIWWIVDIVLLITGNLTPEDGSNWTPIA